MLCSIGLTIPKKEESAVAFYEISKRIKVKLKEKNVMDDYDFNNFIEAKSTWNIIDRRIFSAAFLQEEVQFKELFLLRGKNKNKKVTERSICVVLHPTRASRLGKALGAYPVNGEHPFLF